MLRNVCSGFGLILRDFVLKPYLHGVAFASLRCCHRWIGGLETFPDVLGILASAARWMRSSIRSSILSTESSRQAPVSSVNSVQSASSVLYLGEVLKVTGGF